MTYTNIEPIIYKIGIWIAENIPEYLNHANTEMISWPNGITIPEILSAQAVANTVPALKKIGFGTSIPTSGPFPYLLIDLDSIDLEPAGQLSNWVKLRLKLIVALQENNEKRLLPDLLRYIDVIAHAIGQHTTLGGIVDEAEMVTFDKDELPGTKTGFIIGDLVVKFELTCD